MSEKNRVSRHRIEQIKASAERDAGSSLNTVEVLLSVLVEKMTEIHGGDWCGKVDHDLGYVFIIPKPGVSR
jgi:hypothetical protein